MLAAQRQPRRAMKDNKESDGDKSHQRVILLPVHET